MLALKRLKANLVKWLEISVRRHHLDQALCQLSPHMRGRVVEVGGGRIAHRGGFRPPTPMAAHGNNESPCWLTVDIAPDRSPHLQADAQSLPFASASFDMCVALEMLEYVPIPSKALEEFHRILRPGGVLILSVPFMHRQDAANDLWRWTSAGITRLVVDAGFAVEKMETQAAAFGVAANILKYTVFISSPGMTKHILAILFMPLAALLWSLDRHVTACLPVLGYFTTGTLLIARK